MRKNYYKDITLLLIAIILMGIGGYLFLVGNIGGDALLVLNQGIGNVLNINTGTAMILLNIVTFLIVLYFNKKSIGLGTIAVTLLLGLVIDFFVFLDLLKTGSNLFINILIVLSGIIIGGFGIALYIFAELGLSPNEGMIMYIIEKSNIRFGIIKIIVDLVFFTVGYLLGGTVGIGSLITIILFGPTIDLFLTLLCKFKKDIVKDSVRS